MDRLAKRYGKWPHEVLELPPYELSLAMLCAHAGRERAANEVRRMGDKGPMGVALVADLE